MHEMKSQSVNVTELFIVIEIACKYINTLLWH
jgi:hypothetical protein